MRKKTGRENRALASLPETLFFPSLCKGGIGRVDTEINFWIFNVYPT
jgi:hypothetical protein